MRGIGSRGTALIERSEWGARPPRASYAGINPTRGVTGHWEGPSIGWPWDHAACYSLVRGIQAFHMDVRGWSDIAYTALVCGHGYAFEGRGPGARPAAHGMPGNAESYAVCFLAGEGDEFTDASKRGWADAREWLEAEGGASSELLCHLDWMNTACPGGDRCQWIHDGADPGGIVPTPAPEPPPTWQPPPPPPPANGRIALATLWLARPYLKSPTVATCQGFMDYAGGDRDGVYGPHTRDGVKWCQAASGLTADGACGDRTWTAFVQARLDRDHGESLDVDGDFGGLTTAAVRRFQEAAGLRVDGIVGVYTAGALAP